MAPQPEREKGSSVRRILDHPRGGPTILRIVLGTQLRRLREARGISREQAGEAIRGSHTKISRLELGRTGYKERDVADLLTLYGATDPDEREGFFALARKASVPGWWNTYSDVLPQWFEQLLGLEEAASVIRSYEVQFVPGLLQTRDYARACTRLGHPRANEEETREARPVADDPAEGARHGTRAASVGRHRRGRAAPPAGQHHRRHA